MKTGQKTNSGKPPFILEYINKLHEAGKEKPASWIIVSPRIAEEFKKTKKISKNGRK